MKKAKKPQPTPTQLMEDELEELFDLVETDERKTTIIITDEDDEYEEPPNGFWW